MYAPITDDIASEILARDPLLIRSLVLVSKRLAALAIRTFEMWERGLVHVCNDDSSDDNPPIYKWTELPVSVGGLGIRHGEACILLINDTDGDPYNITVTYCLGRRVGRWVIDTNEHMCEELCGYIGNPVIISRIGSHTGAYMTIGGDLTRDLDIPPEYVTDDDIHKYVMEQIRREDEVSAGVLYDDIAFVPIITCALMIYLDGNDLTSVAEWID